MTKYYKVTDKKTGIVNIFIAVDTLNAFVPGHFDKIRNTNIPTTGGFILFNYICHEHNNRNWKYICNMENIKDVCDYIKFACNIKKNVSLYEIEEEEAIIESTI